MTLPEKFFIVSLMGLAFGAPIYLPWVLARFGKYRGWYLVHFVPPFVWNRSIYLFPASAGFVCMPILLFLPYKGDALLMIWGNIGIAGFILASIIAIWTPRWLKPKWQRYLEDNYTQEEIRYFIPIWREMDKQEWSAYLDSEEGIDELVKITREKLGGPH